MKNKLRESKFSVAIYSQNLSTNHVAVLQEKMEKQNCNPQLLPSSLVPIPYFKLLIKTTKRYLVSITNTRIFLFPFFITFLSQSVLPPVRLKTIGKGTISPAHSSLYRFSIFTVLVFHSRVLSRFPLALWPWGKKYGSGRSSDCKRLHGVCILSLTGKRMYKI